MDMQANAVGPLDSYGHYDYTHRITLSKGILNDYNMKKTAFCLKMHNR